MTTYSDSIPDSVLFGNRFAVPTGLKHGTVTVLTETAPPRHVEVTTFRGEGIYLDGRRPSSQGPLQPAEDQLERGDQQPAVGGEPEQALLAGDRHRDRVRLGRDAR